MSKVYALEKNISETVVVNSMVVNLVGHTSVTENTIFKDHTEQKVNSALKKSYAAENVSM